jgi:hypothetical protein
LDAGRAVLLAVAPNCAVGGFWPRGTSWTQLGYAAHRPSRAMVPEAPVARVRDLFT